MIVTRVILLLWIASIGSCMYGREKKKMAPKHNFIDDEGIRIIGGTLADIREHPYAVSIQIGKRHYCGGSLIAWNWVLTAAHCLVNMADYGPIPVDMFRLVMGDNYVNHIWKSRGQQVSWVEASYPHSLFTNQSVDHDIGLLKSEDFFYRSASVGLVQLPTTGLRVKAGKRCQVCGWGRTFPPRMIGMESRKPQENKASKSSRPLKVVSLPVLSHKRCQNLMKNHEIQEEAQLCATVVQHGGNGFCVGDTGGALLCSGVQVGIISWGTGCADSVNVEVYTRVSHYQAWIKYIRTSESKSLRPTYHVFFATSFTYVIQVFIFT